MKNTVKKEFSTAGFIDQFYNMSTLLKEYWLYFRLNDSAHRIQLGSVDVYPEKRNDYAYVEPFFPKRELQAVHAFYENRHDIYKDKPLPVFANVNGTYVFDMNNPDNDHVEIENVSCMNVPDVSVSLNRSCTYTGIITSIELNPNSILLTLDTANVKFICPDNIFKKLSLYGTVTLYVDEHVMPSVPRSYKYIVTDAKLL